MGDFIELWIKSCFYLSRVRISRDPLVSLSNYAEATEKNPANLIGQKHLTWVLSGNGESLSHFALSGWNALNRQNLANQKVTGVKSCSGQKCNALQRNCISGSPYKAKLAYFPAKWHCNFHWRGFFDQVLGSLSESQCRYEWWPQKKQPYQNLPVKQHRKKTWKNATIRRDKAKRRFLQVTGMPTGNKAKLQNYKANSIWEKLLARSFLWLFFSISFKGIRSSLFLRGQSESQCRRCCCRLVV